MTFFLLLIFIRIFRTSMTEFDCDNFEVPWFTFDGLILSCRAMIVMAVLLIVAGKDVENEYF